MPETSDDLDHVYRRRSDVLFQRDLAFVVYDDIPAALTDPAFEGGDDDEPAMLVSDHGQLFELNVLGGFVWDSIDGVRSVDGIVGRVVEVFDVDPGTARGHVVQLIGDFVRFGLVDPL